MPKGRATVPSVPRTGCSEPSRHCGSRWTRTTGPVLAAWAGYWVSARPWPTGGSGETSCALWRARRAVIVGDPLQLEPIFHVPGQVQNRLRGLFGVDRAWLPAGTSAQGMADRHNRWGTEITVENRNRDMEKLGRRPAAGAPPLRAAHVRDH